VISAIIGVGVGRLAVGDASAGCSVAVAGIAVKVGSVDRWVASTTTGACFAVAGALPQPAMTTRVARSTKHRNIIFLYILPPWLIEFGKAPQPVDVHNVAFAAFFVPHFSAKILQNH
jgi:hypothetical protein